MVSGATVPHAGTRSLPSQGGSKAKGSKVVARLSQISESLKNEKKNVKQPWIKSPQADTIFGITILLNAAFIGIDIELGIEGFNWGLWCTESAFLLIFVIEIFMRLWGERPNFCNYFDGWGMFDTTVTLLGIADAWVLVPILGSSQDNPLSSFTVLRVFRLIRLVRLIRVLRMFSELVVLIQTIGNSLRAVAWMTMLLGMIMYTGSIITVLLIGEPHKADDPDVDKYFGSLGSALFFHFCVVTLEGWPDVAQAAMKHNRLWALYFVFMIILTNFALVNLMVGVIVERIIHISQEQENELASFVAESEQFKATLQVLFDSADMDSSGEVSCAEIRTLLNNHRTHEIMSAFGINLNIPNIHLHTIMDLNREGTTSFKQFFDACMRLCGSKQSIHSLFVQHDICECQQELTRRLQDLEQQLKHVIAKGGVGRVGPAGGIGGSGTDMPAGTPEAMMGELLERMDRFGHVQQNISAEMHALREYAKLSRNSHHLGGSTGAGSGGIGPQLVHHAGKELDACCVGFDAMLSSALAPQEQGRRRGPSPSPERCDLDRSLRQTTRRELEAEFRLKRGPGPLPTR